MANPILISLANQHKRDMQRLTNLANKQWTDSQRYARTLSEKEWARFTRAVFTQTVTEFAPLAAAAAAANFDTTRALWIAQFGVQKVKSFAADPSLAMKSKDLIIDKRKQELGYHIDRAFKGEISINQVSSPGQQILSSGISDFAREEQLLLSIDDNFSKGVQRIARPDGCEYCKYKAIEGGDKFHAGCGCSNAAKFDGGDDDAYREAWMDDFEKEVASAKESLRNTDNSLTTKDILHEVRAARSNNNGEA